ncbi:hypothetical protein N865_05645 [Intrasporangium oryzae NRRL B-24470]|uniref:DUF4037 domain-containing protein n=1 Tax=Intrasporangium oryzae NRRL B-24470 TaxID=1386089 RepID=W9GBM1_9MICO|nr:DUF4037 domain-containing protein [Intrasporangium oryzae]EWT01264.1 hypothetical protein N865_05645 [Intrasporangium oryzae NRRL B-24470]
MSTFVPGAELSRRLYDQVVQPILSARFPDLTHSAALLGRGSEVLGFDDEMSCDHDWRPRVLVFLAEDDEPRHGADVREALQRDLPPTFAGHPPAYEVHTVRGYVRQQLELDIDRDIEPQDWLTLPEQGLRMFTSGVVFHDELGLQAARDRLAYYPKDVWLYLLIAGWWRVHPEMNLVGRAAAAGDELGSSLIGSRLVGDLMRLAFLMERQYAPYSKWFGTAFSRLACGPELTPLLWNVMRAEAWEDREAALMTAYEKLFQMHNALGLTAPVTTEVVQMWGRPFKVAWADIPGLLLPLIQDPAVVSIARRWPVGPVDQFRELFWAPKNRQLLLRLFD